jgi:hypothetical protein
MLRLILALAAVVNLAASLASRLSEVRAAGNKNQEIKSKTQGAKAPYLKKGPQHKERFQRYLDQIVLFALPLPCVVYTELQDMELQEISQHVGQSHFTTRRLLAVVGQKAALRLGPLHPERWGNRPASLRIAEN